MFVQYKWRIDESARWFLLRTRATLDLIKFPVVTPRFVWDEGLQRCHYRCRDLKLLIFIVILIRAPGAASRGASGPGAAAARASTGRMAVCPRISWSCSRTPTTCRRTWPVRYAITGKTPRTAGRHHPLNRQAHTATRKGASPQLGLQESGGGPAHDGRRTRRH
jgi:hypothetical protein